MKVFALCIVSAILLGFGFFWSTSKSRAVSQNEQLPTVINETEAFAVESLTSQVAHPELGGTRYFLKLKNVSGKKITALAVQQPGGGIEYTDYIVSGGGITPAAIKEIEMADYSGQVARPKQITIKLAVFENGSSEGDFEAHKYVKDKRLGEKIQLEQINKVLQTALSLKHGESEVDKKKWLEQVIANVSALSEVASSEQIGFGLKGAKSSILFRLNGLAAWQEVRQTDAAAADMIMRTQSGEMYGASSSADGIAKLIRFNKLVIDRYKEALNEK